MTHLNTCYFAFERCVISIWYGQSSMDSLLRPLELESRPGACHQTCPPINTHKEMYHCLFLKKQLRPTLNSYCYVCCFTYLDEHRSTSQKKTLCVFVSGLLCSMSAHWHAEVTWQSNSCWVTVALENPLGSTVDGRNHAPVEVGSLSHCLQGFIHPRWCRISSINNS